MDNKQTVLAFFHHLHTAETEKISELIAEDADWWIAPTTIFSGTYDKPQFLTLLAQLFEQAAGPYAVQVGELTAEDDRVSVIVSAMVQLKNGKHYQNDYHALFRISDGKILACKEFMDSHRANLAFGFPE